MIKNILVIFALVCFAQAGLRTQVVDDLLAATNNGQITFKYLQGVGYAADVDFVKNSPLHSPMLISLYSSVTLLTQQCLQFSQFNCQQFTTCSRDQKSKFPLAYPYFNAQANIANAQVVLDYSSWALAPGAQVFIANTCTSNAQFPLGAGSFGLLGLGFEGNAQKNYQNAVRAFSVYYNAGAFRLQFNPNLNFPKQQVGQVRVNQNWMIQGITSFGVGTFVKQLGNLQAIFDVNADAIGLPKDLFNAAVTTLKNYGINCIPVPNQNPFYQPTCQYNGTPLPNLVVSVNPQNNIVLTPAMWTLQAPPGQIKLNLRALSPTMTGLNYVTPTYNNFIILGNSVLGNNYVYFNTNDRTITLYQRF